MKATIDIETSLYKQIQKMAFLESSSIKSLIETSLRLFLKHRNPLNKKETEIKEFPTKGGGMTDEFVNASWSEIRDEIYSTNISVNK